MKLNVFIAKNLFLGCTGQPKFDDHEPDVFTKQFERFLATGEESKVYQYENVCWYHLGSYDDETMKFELNQEPVLLVRCSDILSDRKIKAKLMEEAAAREKVEIEAALKKSAEGGVSDGN